ncbi:hypothetical protein JQC67_12505 [Aurantibacter crassamenti]|uniref:hypothetical protein n=1 Tax=Aurantibacter crassamenti TaxID=1837375 RepID=UPI00193A93B1|nr:hypothetical protein [Aurantibacter crassamenti]MBM1106964.1 hypothetical protein [Aurantibacter crassamenti]
MKSGLNSDFYYPIIKFIANYGLIIGGLFILLFGLLAMNKAKTQMDITTEGRKVMVEVIESPPDCERIGRRGGFAKLKFNGKVFNKKTGHKFCSLVEGKKKITMLTNAEKSKIIFLNEYEKENNWIAGIGLCLFGIVIAYKGWKQE